MNLGRENEIQEFKESLSQLDKGIKSLSAMLNRSGYGTVYFGVDDNGNIIGTQIGKKSLMDIRNRIKDLIEPKILADISVMRDENNREFIKVSANGSDIPYSCDGRYYVRNVSADESVSNELLRKMLASGDTDLIRQQASEIQDLTFNQLFTALAGTIHTKDSATFYNNYGLLNKNGHFNFMAYLLSDQNNLSIKVVRFNGINKASMSERTEYGRQCLLLTVNRVLEYFKAFNTTKVDVTEGNRKESFLFSYEAFREAWINACLHNRWHEHVPPAIYIFDDRIEIISYGGLPYGLSEEGFFNGSSHPVNRSLLTLFIVAGLAEQSGHGVPIIVSKYGRESFSFADGLVKVILRYSYEPVVVSNRKALEIQQNKLTDNQQKVYQYLLANPQSNLQMAADNFGISLGGVKKIVARLQELNLICRQGSKRTGHWAKVDFKSRL